MKEIVSQILTDLNIHARFRRETSDGFDFRVSFWSSRCAVALRSYSWIVTRAGDGSVLLSIKKQV